MDQCLAALGPQARQVLLLRTGVGSRRAYSQREVAHMLHIGLGREVLIEYAAVTELQVSAATGGCGGGSLAMIQVPAQDRLVALGLVLSGQAQTTALGGPSQGAGAAQTPGRTTAARSPRRGSAPTPSAIEKAAFGRLPTASTPATVLVLGGAALLGILALLSAAGRRLAEQGQVAVASAPSASRSAAGQAPLAASPVLGGSAVAAVAASSAGPGEPPAHRAPAHPRGVGAPTAASTVTRARPSVVWSAAGSAPLDASGAAAASPPDAATPPDSASPPDAATAPDSAAPPNSAAPPTAASSRSANQQWLQMHRSQIALVLTAAAGGALRVIRRRQH